MTKYIDGQQVDKLTYVPESVSRRASTNVSPERHPASDGWSHSPISHESARSSLHLSRVNRGHPPVIVEAISDMKAAETMSTGGILMWSILLPAASSRDRWRSLHVKRRP